MQKKRNMNKRIMALDVGDRTCGVAISDIMLITAQPITTLRYKNHQERTRLFQELLQLMTTYDVGRVVVGLPLNMNGSAGPQSVKVRDFVTQLQKLQAKKSAAHADVIWEFWDERLSTSGAEKALVAANVSRAKRKDVIDKMAAVFILQGYLGNFSSEFD